MCILSTLLSLLNVKYNCVDDSVLFEAAIRFLCNVDIEPLLHGCHIPPFLVSKKLRLRFDLQKFSLTVASMA